MLLIFLFTMYLFFNCLIKYPSPFIKHSIFFTLWYIILLQAVLNLQVTVEHSKEVNDCKHLIKTLVMGNWSSPHFLLLCSSYRLYWYLFKEPLCDFMFSYTPDSIGLRSCLFAQAYLSLLHILSGMKTIIWSITHAHLPRSQVLLTILVVSPELVNICYLIQHFWLFKVSPSTHGTQPQVLVSSSSNLSAAQAFKGMREDEVF